MGSPACGQALNLRETKRHDVTTLLRLRSGTSCRPAIPSDRRVGDTAGALPAASDSAPGGDLPSGVRAAAAVLVAVGPVIARQLQPISAPGNVIGVLGQVPVRAVRAADRTIARSVVDSGSVVHCRFL